MEKNELVIELIGKGKLPEALNTLIGSKDLQAHHFMARYNSIQKQFRSGFMTNDEFTTKITHLNSSIIEYCKDNFLPEANAIREDLASNFIGNKKFFWIERKIWNDLYTHRYYYEYYSLQMERLKNTSTAFSQSPDQMSLLSQMRSCCLDYSRKLEAFWMQLPDIFGDSFFEQYITLTDSYEKELISLDNALKLKNNKKIYTRAEKTTFDYFDRIYNLTQSNV